MTDTTPRFMPLFPTELDWSDSDVIDAIVVSAGGHGHIDGLREVSNKLLEAFSGLHFLASLTGKDCHDMAQHDEIVEELNRLEVMATKARAGLWN